jgi:2-hydroxy-3-oxopropionate reductase
MKVAFLGTGLMGAPMARKIAAAGHHLTVWNRDLAKAQALADVATVAETPLAAVSGAEVIIAMLMDGAAVRSVLLDQGVIEACSAGTVLVDMGSVDPATDRYLAGLAQARGVGFVDAPVSGGVVGAEAATLSIFVGGEAADIARVMPVLTTMGRPTHLGGVGAGQITKLANQLIVANTIGAIAEGLSLAEAGGCDIKLVREALRGGFADSRILELHGARMVAGNFTPGGRSKAQLKDLDNALAVAAEVGLDLPLSRRITNGFRDLVETHDGADLDHSAYFLWLKMRQKT